MILLHIDGTQELYSRRNMQFLAMQPLYTCDHVSMFIQSLFVLRPACTLEIKSKPGVSNGEGDAESVKAWHLLERSHNTFWQLQYGNMSYSEAP